MSKRKRALITALLAAAALFTLLGAVVLIAQRQERVRGALDGLPPADLPPRVPVLGINADLTQYDAAALAENLDRIAALGFVWVRQTFAWEEIEPQPGHYEWATYDAIVEALAARGLRPVAVLGRSPAWAADNPTAPPQDAQDFARFASAFATRYGDRVDVYQIWDEPNRASGWGGRPADPIGYATLLQVAYRAIHAADPHALVLTGGLTPTVETGPDNLNDVLYLRVLYEKGAAPFFDGVAANPYGLSSGPDDRRVDIHLLNFSRLVLLREEMERQGDRSKPLWVTQLGWDAQQIAPEQQAVWTVAAYRRALAEWPWSGALILDGWQPNAAADDPRWGFALRQPDGSLSPAAEAIQAQAELFNSALWPGVYTPTHPLLIYSGDWQFSELGADFSPQGNSAVDVPFIGDTLALIVRRDRNQAYLYVTVDGELPRNLPWDDEGAYLTITSPDYQPRIETLSVATGLQPEQRHVAHIEARYGWTQWAVVGFAVGRHIDTSAYDALIGVLLALSVGLIGWVLWIGRGLRWGIPLQQAAVVLAMQLDGGLHLILSFVAALAVWVGAALTWGGLVPNLLRRVGEGSSLILTVLTAGVFYFSPWLALTLTALVVLFVLIYAKPSLGLALIAAFAPYYLMPRPLFDKMLSLVETVSLLTLIAWAIHIVAARQEKGWTTPLDLRRQMTALDKALALFVGLAVISLSWAELVGVAFTDLRQVVIEPLVAYLVLRTMPLTPRERWRIVDLLILTGTVVAFIGLVQVITGSNVILAEGGMPRLRSVYNSPNNAALILGRLIPIAAAVALLGGNRLRRWLYGAAAVTMLIAAIWTLSKGALLLGLPAGLALVVILWAGRKGLIAAAVGIILEILALIPLSRLPRFSGLVDFASGTSTTFFRLNLWRSTLRMLRDHPITGVGMDQFLYQYRGRYILPAAWREPDLSQPHNFLLNYWVRLGIAGLAAGIWIQVAFWRMAWRAQRRLRSMDSDAWALTIGLMGSMAALVAHGMVDEAHFVVDLAFIFFITLGLMHQLHEEAKHGGHDQRADVAAG